MAYPGYGAPGGYGAVSEQRIQYYLKIKNRNRNGSSHDIGRHFESLSFKIIMLIIYMYR